MKSILTILAVSLFLVGCGTRKVEKEVHTQKTDVKESTNTAISHTEKTLSIESLQDLNFSMKPTFQDTCRTETIRVKDGQGRSLEIPVFSNSEVNFGQKNENKQENKIVHDTVTVYKYLEAKNDIADIEKKTDRKAAPWGWFALIYFAGLVTIPIVKIIIKK